MQIAAANGSGLPTNRMPRSRAPSVRLTSPRSRRAIQTANDPRNEHSRLLSRRLQVHIEPPDRLSEVIREARVSAGQSEVRTMRAPRHSDETDVNTGLLQRALHDLRLLDRHDGIGIAVHQQHRWIVTGDVCQR